MEIENIIEKSDLKLTNARKEILQNLLEAKNPLSYEDLKSKIHMDKATFYRNISKFEDAHIVNSFESNDKKRYFEVSQTPHAHFICNLCNMVECIKEDFHLPLEGYVIENIIIKGICKSCNL